MAAGAPLADLIVLDLTQFAAGPYCTMLLADAGARVIKVEPPQTGDPYREEGPISANGEGLPAPTFYLRFNRNKECITLNLKSEAGRSILERLAKRADVLVENFRPGVMERLELDYPRLREVNPRLVYASISGFGQQDFLPSPDSNLPAFAIVAEAMAGIMDRIGDAGCEPHWSAVSVGDLYAGGLAVGGIMMAVHQRSRTGFGQHVDLSMVDTMVSLNERALFTFGVTGIVPHRGAEMELAPFGAYEASDGWIVIGVIGEPIWGRFCSAIDRIDLLDDPRLQGGVNRARAAESVLKPAISGWLGGRTRKEAVESLLAAGVPAAPVRDAREVAQSAHVAARDMLVDVDTAGRQGSFKVVGSPIKLSAQPRAGRATAHALGEDTDAVLGELAALSGQEIRRLRSEGVV